MEITFLLYLVSYISHDTCSGVSHELKCFLGATASSETRNLLFSKDNIKVYSDRVRMLYDIDMRVSYAYMMRELCLSVRKVSMT